jgi:hypothetical protein
MFDERSCEGPPNEIGAVEEVTVIVPCAPRSPYAAEDEMVIAMAGETCIPGAAARVWETEFQ